MRLTFPLVGLLIAGLWSRTTLAETSSSTDPFAQLQQIRDVFLEGSYDDVVRRSTALLDEEPTALVRASALQYLGAALELLGNTEEAEVQFEVLLTLQPEFQLNRAEFPTEVISLFESVRLRVQDRLDQFAEQRRRQQDVARRDRERRLLEQQRRLVELARPRYVVREVERRNLIVALLPFGAGQFQNGHERRGWAFFGTQLGLTGASMAFWLLGTLAEPNPADTSEARDLFRAYQISSYVVYGSLAVAVIWGIVDALVSYRRLERRQDSWREVDERGVPEEFRLEVDPELLRLDETLGAGAQVPAPTN